MLGMSDDLESGRLVEDLGKAAKVVGVAVGDDRQPDLARVSPDVADPAQDRAAVPDHSGIDQEQRLVGFDEVAVRGDALDAVDSHGGVGATPVPTGVDAVARPRRRGVRRLAVRSALAIE